MRILVCGGRDFNDYKAVLDTIEVAIFGIPPNTSVIIVHGAARGADSLAGKAARELRLLEEPHPARWDLYGKSAGFRRNAEMIDSGIDYGIVFPGGNGTKDMMERLYHACIPFRFWGKGD